MRLQPSLLGSLCLLPATIFATSQNVTVDCTNAESIELTVPYALDYSIVGLEYGTCRLSSSGISATTSTNPKGFKVTVNSTACQPSKSNTHELKLVIGASLGSFVITFEQLNVKAKCEVDYPSPDTRILVVYEYGSLVAKESNISVGGETDPTTPTFEINAYNEDYSAKLAEDDIPTIAGEFIYLGLRMNSTNSADYVFALHSCKITELTGNVSVELFNVDAGTCGNSIISLEVGYRAATTMWTIEHILFLLGTNVGSEYSLSCYVDICAADKANSSCRTAAQLCTGSSDSLNNGNNSTGGNGNTGGNNNNGTDSGNNTDNGESNGGNNGGTNDTDSGNSDNNNGNNTETDNNNNSTDSGGNNNTDNGNTDGNNGNNTDTDNNNNGTDGGADSDGNSTDTGGDSDNSSNSTSTDYVCKTVTSDWSLNTVWWGGYTATLTHDMPTDQLGAFYMKATWGGNPTSITWHAREDSAAPTLVSGTTYLFEPTPDWWYCKKDLVFEMQIYHTGAAENPPLIEPATWELCYKSGVCNSDGYYDPSLDGGNSGGNLGGDSGGDTNTDNGDWPIDDESGKKVTASAITDWDCKGTPKTVTKTCRDWMDASSWTFNCNDLSAEAGACISGHVAVQTSPNWTASTSEELGKQNGHDYNEVVSKSLLFYEAQQSGILPSWNRIPWRSHSNLYDGCHIASNPTDLTGGWFDAGDNMKFHLPMGNAAISLFYGAIEFTEAYDNMGELGNLKNNLKFVTDYFIKTHPSANVYYGQVGDGNYDHNHYARPEKMSNQCRPVWKCTPTKPCTDASAQVAASLAAASIFFSQQGDTAYAKTCYDKAVSLTTFSDSYRANYDTTIIDAAEFYASGSSGYYDELANAWSWLAKASKIHDASSTTSYTDKAMAVYSTHLTSTPTEYSWQLQTPVVLLNLVELTGEQSLWDKLDSFVSVQYLKRTTTPGGLPYVNAWGTNRYAANLAMIGMGAVKLHETKSKAYGLGMTKDEIITKSADVVAYIMGDNPKSLSYVVGYTKDGTKTYPKEPHHKPASCPLWSSSTECGWNTYSNPGNPYILYGAVVGGPDSSDNFSDNRNSYESTEVTTDYNAGFQSALAGLKLNVLGKL